MGVKKRQRSWSRESVYDRAYVWHENTDGQGSVGALTPSPVRQHCYSGNKGGRVLAFRV